MKNYGRWYLKADEFKRIISDKKKMQQLQEDEINLIGGG